ncbi:MAG: hypothetical protein QME51_04120 [Planctomycetota bacterium]|nr:hypothetical protein [Planctomycetota bacterium]
MHSYKEKGTIGTSHPSGKEAAHRQAIAIAMNKAGMSKLRKRSK